MTPPPLPDLLRRLAELMPSRVHFEEDTGYYHLKLLGGWERAIVLSEQVNTWGQIMVEQALREECWERNWNISMDVYAQESSSAWVLTPDRPLAYRAEAPTPTHALAAAMVSALEGEG